MHGSHTLLHANGVCERENPWPHTYTHILCNRENYAVRTWNEWNHDEALCQLVSWLRHGYKWRHDGDGMVWLEHMLTNLISRSSYVSTPTLHPYSLPIASPLPFRSWQTTKRLLDYLIARHNNTSRPGTTHFSANQHILPSLWCLLRETVLSN